MTQRSPANIFVALVPPATVTEPLAAALAPVQRRETRVAWVSRQRWHLTLAFLGVVDPEPLISRRLTLPGVGELTLTGAGTFGTAVLWAGVQGALDGLAAEVRRQAAVPNGDDRPFRPHVTVGRARGRHGWSGLKRLAAELDYPARRWRPERVLLMRSRAGQPYEQLADWPLGPGREGPVSAGRC